MRKVLDFPFILFVITLVSSQPLSYSARYSNVSYQPQNRSSDREEVTEKTKLSPRIQEHDSEPILAEFIDITTEKDSEQVNFKIFRHDNMMKDKLENLETTTVISQPTTPNIITSNGINFVEEVEILRQNDEILNGSTESEVSDLNEQGVYFIIHPNGLFQKVVYKTENEPEEMRNSNPGSAEPIVEPIYTYDPRTFVLQRLYLRPHPYH